MASPLKSVRFHNLSSNGESVGVQNVGAQSVGFESVGAQSDVSTPAGRTIFARGVAPGEVAQVEIKSEHKNYARGVAISLEVVSPSRVSAPCGYFGIVDSALQQRDLSPENGCGGCAWQHIEYSMQAQAKREIVVQALRRVAGLGDAAESLVAPCIASPRTFGYRNKAEIVVAGSANTISNADTIPKHNAQIGFRARESHRVVDVARCLIQDEGNNLLLKLLREAVTQNLISPFDETRNCGVLKRAILRTSSRRESLVVLETSEEKWAQEKQFADFLMRNAPQLRGVLSQNAQGKLRVWAGRDWLEENVGALKMRVIGADFFQINSAATPILLQTALEMADVKNGERVLDLYCGVGLFALALAKNGAKVVGIEGNARAIAQAKQNAILNDCSAEFYAGNAVDALRRWRAKNPDGVDVVVLDPPRAGAKDCLAEIVALRPRRIVYVSCDAATLARDIKVLGTNGFQLRRAVPLDMFPQTAHVETIAQIDAV